MITFKWFSGLICIFGWKSKSSFIDLFSKSMSYIFQPKSYKSDFIGPDVKLFAKKSSLVRYFPQQTSASFQQWAIKVGNLKHIEIKTRNHHVKDEVVKEIINCVLRQRLWCCVSNATTWLPPSLRSSHRFGPQTRPGGGAVHRHQVHQRRVPERPGASGQRLSRRGHGPPSASTLPLLAAGAFHEVSDVVRNFHVSKFLSHV